MDFTISDDECQVVKASGGVKNKSYYLREHIFRPKMNKLKNIAIDDNPSSTPKSDEAQEFIRFITDEHDNEDKNRGEILRWPEAQAQMKEKDKYLTSLTLN